MQGAEASEDRIRMRWFTLAMLTAVYSVSYIDRTVLMVLAEPIKNDLNLSDTQIGLLGGFAFALLYTVAGIPIAWLADRGFACERVEWQTETWGNALFVHERALSTPSVHAFIFHWGGKDGHSPLAARTHTLAELIGPAVDELTVISSGGTGGSSEWLVLDEDAYFGDQWNRALAEFRGDVLFHHQADAMLLGGDYSRLVAAGRQAFRAHSAGIYAPRVDFSAHDHTHRAADEKSAGIFSVKNTDCTCWMVHCSVLRSQPRKLKSRLGWGIDQLYCDQARAMQLGVLRDYRFLVHHPQGTGYKHDEAMVEYKEFSEAYPVSILGVADGW